MIFSGLLTLIKSAGKNLQVKYLNNKTKANIRNLNSYGFFSNPPQNSKVVCLKDFKGDVYGIAYLDSSIPVLNGNETVVGNFVAGSQIKFDSNGKIQIKNSTTDLLTLLQELKTLLQNAVLADDVTVVFGATTQTALITWITNVQTLLTT